MAATEVAFEVYIAEVDPKCHKGKDLEVVYPANCPVNGRSVYIITAENERDVWLLHPWTLTHFSMPKNDFLRGIGLTYWPEDRRDAPPHEKFNVAGVLKKMDQLLQDFALNGRQHPHLEVRRAIAAIRGIPLEQVPSYKTQVQTAKRVAAGESGGTKERGPRKPGVIDAIKEFLEDGYTVDDMVTKLGERFPDREADGMRNTVKCQLARLPKNTGRAIVKTDVGGGKIVFKWGA